MSTVRQDTSDFDRRLQPRFIVSGRLQPPARRLPENILPTESTRDRQTRPPDTKDVTLTSLDNTIHRQQAQQQTDIVQLRV